MAGRGRPRRLEPTPEAERGATAYRRGGDAPQDRALDRRSFIGRMTAVTAAAAVGGSVVTPLPLAGSGGAGAAGDGRDARRAGAGTGEGGVRAPSRLAPGERLPDPGRIRRQDPAELTLAEAAALIRDGALSPVELLDAYLERIEAHDGLYMAFNTVVAERARDRARRLAGEPWRGPLHGIPVALKDNYYTAGIRTTANSFIFDDFVPEFDATAWVRLREAGAVLLGKTQMGPLATSRATNPEGHVTTVNAWAPRDSDVSPGGSSSGSATAVAARMAAVATGTQTGGSITSPSLAQGLTGIKPTMGRVSLHGIIPLTYTRDHPGPIARDATDAAIALQAMAGPDPADPRTLGLPPVPDYVRAAEPVERGGRPALRWPTTMGVPPGYLDEPDEPEEEPGEQVSQERRRRREEARRRALAEVGARRRMLARFEELGARVVEVEWPEDWETLTSWDFNNVRLPERSEPFLEALKRDVRLFGVSLSPWINGLLLSGTEYLRGQRAKLLLLRRVLDGLLAECDVVLQTRPFPFDMIGLPLIAFPVGIDGGGDGAERPVGAMLGGLPYGEERLLSLVAAYQSVTDWHRRRPPEPAGATSPGARGGGSGPGAAGAAPRDRGRLSVHDVMEHGE